MMAHEQRHPHLHVGSPGQRWSNDLGIPAFPRDPQLEATWGRDDGLRFPSRRLDRSLPAYATMAASNRRLAIVQPADEDGHEN